MKDKKIVLVFIIALLACIYVNNVIYAIANSIIDDIEKPDILIIGEKEHGLSKSELDSK
jgi:hypothetical protein